MAFASRSAQQQADAAGSMATMLDGPAGQMATPIWQSHASQADIEGVARNLTRIGFDAEDA